MIESPTVELSKCPTGPLTLEFFEKLSQGAVIRLYYWTTNQGEMLWKHDRVEGDRVFGAFDDDRGATPTWTEVDDYLYEFMGYVCRGSGAEPVHAHEPTEPFLEC